MHELTLTPEQILEITGYQRQADQLNELHRQGFWRARRQPVSGDVLLERAHYDAVCAGQTAPGKRRGEPEPQLRSQREAA